MMESNMDIAQQVDQSNTMEENRNQLSLLKYTLDYIMKVPKFKCLKNPLQSDDDPMVNTIGLIEIAAKLKKYITLDDFLTDIRCLVQSYSIYYTYKSDQKKAADLLSERCNRDVQNIQLCSDCFESSYIDPKHYFTRACDKPHLVVFAKLDNYPHWPAKLKQITGDMATVEFFGDHTQAVVPVSSCILYSNDLAEESQSTNNVELKIAHEELLLHVKHLKAKFGTFVPSQAIAETVTAENMKQKLVNMIPGAFKVATPATCKQGESIASYEQNESSSAAAPSPSIGTTSKTAPMTVVHEIGGRKRQQSVDSTNIVSKKKKIPIVFEAEPSVIDEVRVDDKQVGQNSDDDKASTETNTEPDQLRNPKSTESATPGTSHVNVPDNEMTLLRHSFDVVLELEEFQLLKGPRKWSIGLNGINAKFSRYTNADEFLADINALIKSYAANCASNRDVKMAIYYLSERCHRDVKSIRTCSECFASWVNDPDDYFTKVCTKPHLIVYAKAVPFQFWPAKLMSINGHVANVEFFDDHTQADVPVENCILYPKEHIIPRKGNKLYDAFKEMDDYIKNIKEKYGAVNPIMPKQTLDPEKLKEHTMQMFPGAFN
ncbi:uncharacterized protein LOC116349425 [Contarinia nasturtii]|uniref:uncharacterized protein LOC116349425 n=1 Tax=Contarinia nasturtii TaxID=265458 RepID=UPI0012D442C1|nr:uncharacterized protein LOC116349425 [Contarinia nasturtii]